MIPLILALRWLSRVFHRLDMACRRLDRMADVAAERVAQYRENRIDHEWGGSAWTGR